MRFKQKSVITRETKTLSAKEPWRVLWRFLCETQATSGVAYALVLCTVLAMVMAGATMLGSTVERSLAQLADGHPSGSLELSSAGTAATNAASVAVAQPESNKAFGLRVVVSAVMCVVALVTAGAGWMLMKRPDVEQEEEEGLIPHRRVQVEESILLTRLNAKKALLWKQLLEDHDLLLKNRIEVHHVMTRDPISIEPATPGEQIAKLFGRHDVAHLMVCDDESRLLGVVKSSDHEANPDEQAEALLKPWPASVPPKTTLGAAISKLMEQDSSFLPVVDDDRLCGLLTPTDLVLTLHCSLQLWFRVARTMEEDTQNVERMEAACGSIDETAAELKRRVQGLPNQVKTALKTGNAKELVTDINEMSSALTLLMQRLDDVQSQIRQQSSQLADLKDPTPDAATGAASREELDRILQRLSESEGESRQSFSLVLYVAGDYHSLLKHEGQEAADEHMRLAMRAIAKTINAHDHIARYRDDAFAIVLPGTESNDARKLCRRLTINAIEMLGGGFKSRPTLSLVSAQAAESPEDLLKRAEVGCSREPKNKELNLAETATSV